MEPILQGSVFDLKKEEVLTFKSLRKYHIQFDLQALFNID